MVCSRKVRAIDGRFFGRVARTLFIGVLSRPEHKRVAVAVEGLTEAARESDSAQTADELRGVLVPACIPIEEVRSFWAKVQDRARRFAQIPGAGDQVYGFRRGTLPH